VAFITLGTHMITVVGNTRTEEAINPSLRFYGAMMMHSNSYWERVCGPGGFFSGFHFGGFLHLLLWGIVLYLIFKAINSRSSASKTTTCPPDNMSSSMTTLEERYASGEIDQQEFLQKKKDLKG
jgi:uncharacterized membrane protein